MVARRLLLLLAAMIPLASASADVNLWYRRLPEPQRTQWHLIWAGTLKTNLDAVTAAEQASALAEFRRRYGQSASLIAESESRQRQRDFRIVRDRVTGLHVGLPFALLPREQPAVRPAGNIGTQWRSIDNKISVDSLRITDNRSLQDLFRRLCCELGPRDIVRPPNHTTFVARDRFVLEGTERTAFYFHVHAFESERVIHALSIGIPAAQQQDLNAVVTAMSSTLSASAQAAIKAAEGGGLPAPSPEPDDRRVPASYQEIADAFTRLTDASGVTNQTVSSADIDPQGRIDILVSAAKSVSSGRVLTGSPTRLQGDAHVLVASLDGQDGRTVHLGFIDVARADVVSLWSKTLGDVAAARAFAEQLQAELDRLARLTGRGVDPHRSVKIFSRPSP